MQARMKNPAAVLPNATKTLQSLFGTVHKSSLAATTIQLVHLRTSQINGCGPCVVGGALAAKNAGESDERLCAVAAWRETQYFSEAERVALELAEEMTRFSDRADQVSDDLWDRLTKHYDEERLAALILAIGTTNLFNRLNVSTRQVAGQESWN